MSGRWTVCKVWEEDSKGEEHIEGEEHSKAGGQQ